MAQAQGALTQTLLQMEPSYKGTPSTVKTKKVYMITNGLAFSREIEQSKVIRGSSRHPTRGVSGNVDVAGPINTELQATSALILAALGSVSITGSGVTVGSALTSPTFAYDWTNQVLTVNSTAHGVVVGDTVEIIATAPSIMNGTFYYPVIDRPTVDQFKVFVPMGGSSTVSLTTIKKCTAGTFTYTFKAGGKLPSYIIETGFPDIGQYFKYVGAMCSKLSFDVKASGIVEMNTDWMGASETPSGTSYETGTAIDNTKINFDSSMLAAADVLEGGVASAIVKSMSFNLDNQLDGDTFVVGGAGVRAGINPGVYNVSGSITAVFQDLTLYNKAKNSTESSLDITFKRGTGAGSAGNESLQVIVPELIFTPKAPGIQGPGGVVVSLDYVGDYTDSANATALSIIIKCTQLPGAVI